MFGEDVPAFNIDGQKKVNTIFGGTVTFIFLLIIGFFAAVKLISVLEKEYPTVSSNYQRDYYSATEELSLNKAKYRFAFAF